MEDQIYDPRDLPADTACRTGNSETWEDIEDFGENYLDELRTLLPYEHGTPSHDRIRTFWGLIKPSVINKLLAKWALLMQSDEGEKICRLVNIDGKTLKGSRSKDFKAIHIVNAYAPGPGLVLGQVAVKGKSNEITAIPELLGMFDLKGKLITIDAMGTQKSIAMMITKEKGDYLLAVKKNHKTLHAEIEAIFSDEVLLEQLRDEGSYFRSEDGALNRQAVREYYQYDDLEAMDESHKWPGIKTIGMSLNTVTQNGKTSREVRYYLSSIKQGIGEFHLSVRGH